MVNAILAFLDDHHTFIIQLIEAGASFVAPEAAPAIIAFGEGVDYRWNQIDRLAAEADAALAEAKTVYAAGSRPLQQIKQKVALINSHINTHKANMSSSRGLFGVHGGSIGPPTPMDEANPHVETIYSDRPTSEYESKRKHRIQNQLFTQMGTSVLAQSGKARQGATKMVIGKRQYNDPIPSFLGNLSGSGVVSNEWSGIIKSSSINTRTSFCTFFRHCMSNADTANGAGGFTVSQAYDTALRAFVLWPFGGGDIAIAGTDGKVTTGSTFVHVDKREYWAPLNRPDYEDMSWNLNKLKLGPDNVGLTYPGPVDGGTSNPVQWNGQHSLMRIAEHRRVSNIMINNALPGTEDPTYPAEPGAQVGKSWPYRYNMVFNYGTIDYCFSNKGSHSSIVEVLVYRIKKGQNIPVEVTPIVPTGTQATLGPVVDPGVAYNNIYAPICEGYLATAVDKYGTDDLRGRTPVLNDVLVNPRFPFLPELKKTQQRNLPVKEIMRKQFTLPSGGRKKVEIILPGDIYDPVSIAGLANVPNTPSTSSGLYTSRMYAQIDDHSYAVVIAVNGTIQSRNFHKDAIAAMSSPQPNPPTGTLDMPVDVPFLDVYGDFDVQYYASYSEHIGACQYKMPSKKKIYVRGAGEYTEFTGDTAVTEQTVVVIPATQVVRTPVSTTKVAHLTLASNGSAYTMSNSVYQSNQGPNQGSHA